MASKVLADFLMYSHIVVIQNAWILKIICCIFAYQKLGLESQNIFYFQL